MTKTMKYASFMLAFVAAAILALAMSTSAAWAVGEEGGEGGDQPVTPTTYKVTITKHASDKAAHTYGAYQIFKGDLAEKDGKKVLSNVQWGDNVDSATIITELKKLEDFSGLASDADAATVAKAIADKQYTANSDAVSALANALNAGITGDPKGTASVAADKTSGEITGLVAGYYLVKDTAAVANEGAQTKYILEVVSNVEVTEKASVPSVDKKIAETTPVEVSDYNIGDSIPYTITGTLPSEFAKYTTYKTFTFTDTMSDGLTPPAADDITVKIGGDDITSLFDVNVTSQTITVSLKNGVDLKTAKHGDPAIAFAANDAIVVSYSATLNDNAVVGGNGNVNTAKLVFSNNPNNDGTGNDDTGETPEDKTVVFTYTIKALKVEADGNPIDQDAYDALAENEKADYVKIGDKWQKTKALSGAGFTLYKKDDKGVYQQVGEEITGVTTFEFKGKDVGEYKLVETTVPNGYNKANDIEITVAATYTNDKPAKINTLTVTPETAGFTADKASGEITGKILNQQGSTLPSTGGMGTTILYIVGAVLVIGAGIFLITKRRVRKESDFQA